MSIAHELHHDAPHDLVAEVRAIAERAKEASAELAQAPTAAKNRALTAGAAELRRRTEALLAANALDVKAAEAGGMTQAFIDRLSLTPVRIEAMAAGLEAIAAFPDPVGATLAEWTRPNGLRIQRVRVPLGVVAVIFESRPNVTADAGALCLKAGNAAILRGGSDSLNSAKAIAAALHAGLSEAGLPEDAIQLVATRDRAAVGALLGLDDLIDVVVPRGGKSLIARVADESRIPVLKHLDGICHVYLDRDADPQIAREVTLNAKMRRVGICGAAETLLVDSGLDDEMVRPVLDDLIQAGCELRGDAAIRALDPRVRPATEEDWATEYLAPIMSVRRVDGVEAAIAHIGRYGSHHTDCIVTANEAAAEHFFAVVDSAILLLNASTQFADGGEFGMGAEIGIGTGKLHARGPVGVKQLTTFKYLVHGNGQTRP